MLVRLLLCCALFMACATAGAGTIYQSTDANGVVSYSDRPTQGSKVFIFRDQMDERLERQVYYVILKKNGVDSVYVRNDLYAPVEIELSFAAVKNVSGAPRKPIRRVIPLRTSVRLVQLTATQAARPLAYIPRLKYSLGDPSGTAKAYRYPLPWRGGPFRISQGANGQYSHFGPKSRYAVDIAMPEGTPIIAARGGVVVKTENSQSGRGSHPSGNFVRVLHDDGTHGRVPAPQARLGARTRRAAGGGGQRAGVIGQYRQQQRPAPAFRGAAKYRDGAGVDSVSVQPAGGRLAEFCIR